MIPTILRRRYLRCYEKSWTFEHIDVSGHTGKTNGLIWIGAKDDFKVDRVIITIHNSKGKLIEKGNAVMEENWSQWKYTVTINVKNVKGCKICATAVDIPGNKGFVKMVV